MPGLIQANQSAGCSDTYEEVVPWKCPQVGLRVSGNAGAKVAIAELPLGFLAGPDKGGVGGTCVLRGCVPKKLMLYASEFATEAQASKGFG